MALLSARFKQIYLANLQQDINNVNRTENAVAMKLSGNTVPEQPQDTRSVSQKYADYERNKIDLRSKLLSITDGEQAGLIIDQLEDDRLLVFALENFSELADISRKKFPLGIQEPNFIALVERLSDQFDLNNSVSGQLEELFVPLSQQRFQEEQFAQAARDAADDADR